VNPTKTAEPIEMAFGMWTWVDQRNHVLDEGPDHRMQRVNSDGKKVICMGNGWLKEQDQQFFNNSFRALEKCWTKCISVAGDYAEK